MNPDTTLPLDFAPLREGAEEMARHLCGARADNEWERRTRREPRPRPTGWQRDPDVLEVRAFARLLSDLTIDATRDRWVRWGIARDVALELARHPDVDDPVRALMRTNLTRNFGRRWSALRDDPEALRAAILAALETR